MEPTRVNEFDDARGILGAAGLDADALARDVCGRVKGTFIRAVKP